MNGNGQLSPVDNVERSDGVTSSRWLMGHCEWRQSIVNSRQCHWNTPQLEYEKETCHTEQTNNIEEKGHKDKHQIYICFDTRWNIKTQNIYIYIYIYIYIEYFLEIYHIVYKKKSKI